MRENRKYPNETKIDSHPSKEVILGQNNEIKGSSKHCQNLSIIPKNQPQ